MSYVIRHMSHVTNATATDLPPPCTVGWFSKTEPKTQNNSKPKQLVKHIKKVLLVLQF